MKAKIRFLVLDVDGTLTDGKIYMAESGELFKTFDIKDGCHCFLCAVDGAMEVLIPYKNAKKISYSILCMGAGLVIEIILAVFTNKMGELKVLLVNIKLSSWKKYVELSIVVFSCF